jgi:hypothetical protein
LSQTALCLIQGMMSLVLERRNRRHGRINWIHLILYYMY